MVAALKTPRKNTENPGNSPQNPLFSLNPRGRFGYVTAAAVALRRGDAGAIAR
jgi:hypothetical protein